jgi:hypothetical protein
MAILKSTKVNIFVDGVELTEFRSLPGDENGERDWYGEVTRIIMYVESTSNNNCETCHD